jgi:hypothetical protein
MSVTSCNVVFSLEETEIIQPTYVLADTIDWQLLVRLRVPAVQHKIHKIMILGFWVVSSLMHHCGYQRCGTKPETRKTR